MESLFLWLQLYDEMGSRHRVRPPLINIIKTATVPNAQCKRDNTKQFHQQYDEPNNKQVRVKFPLTRKLVRSVPCYLLKQTKPPAAAKVCCSMQKLHWVLGLILASLACKA